MRWPVFASAVVAASVLWTNAASATVSLQWSMTVDNSFNLWLSPSPTTAGTLLGSNVNPSWFATSTGSAVINTTGTQYLHVQAYNVSSIAMFLGEFTFSSTDGTFSNGGQSLLSNSVNWTVSAGSYGQTPVVPLNLGPNLASNPNAVNWAAPRPNISTSADFLWHPVGALTDQTVYFTTVVNIVPEPQTVVALAVGAMLALRRRRRR